MSRNNGAGAAIQQAISITTAEIKVLNDKVASNELKQQKLGDQITTLFKAAQSELQQVQEITPKPELTLKTRLTAHVSPGQVSGV